MFDTVGPHHTKGVVRLSTRVRCALYFVYLTNRIRSNEITYTYTQSVDGVHHFSPPFLFFYLLTVLKCAPAALQAEEAHAGPF